MMANSDPGSMPEGSPLQESATVGKVEDQFYVMKNTEAKKPRRISGGRKPSQNSFQKSSKVVDFHQENRPGRNPQFSARRYILFLRVYATSRIMRSEVGERASVSYFVIFLMA